MQNPSSAQAKEKSFHCSGLIWVSLHMKVERKCDVAEAMNLLLDCKMHQIQSAWLHCLRNYRKPTSQQVWWSLHCDALMIYAHPDDLHFLRNYTNFPERLLATEFLLLCWSSENCTSCAHLDEALRSIASPDEALVPVCCNSGESKVAVCVFQLREKPIKPYVSEFTWFCRSLWAAARESPSIMPGMEELTMVRRTDTSSRSLDYSKLLKWSHPVSRARIWRCTRFKSVLASSVGKQSIGF